MSRPNLPFFPIFALGIGMREVKSKPLFRKVVERMMSFSLFALRTAEQKRDFNGWSSRWR